MAFDIRNLSEVRALGNGRWHWHYFTTDTLAACLAADYFSTNNGLSRMHRGDVLEIVASTAAESQQVTVSSVSGGSVVLLQSSAGAATDATARAAAVAAQATADAAMPNTAGALAAGLATPTVADAVGAVSQKWSGAGLGPNEGLKTYTNRRRYSFVGEGAVADWNGAAGTDNMPVLKSLAALGKDVEIEPGDYYLNNASLAAVAAMAHKTKLHFRTGARFFFSGYGFPVLVGYQKTDIALEGAELIFTGTCTNPASGAFPVTQAAFQAQFGTTQSTGDRDYNFAAVFVGCDRLNVQGFRGYSLNPGVANKAVQGWFSIHNKADNSNPYGCKLEELDLADYVFGVLSWGQDDQLIRAVRSTRRDQYDNALNAQGHVVYVSNHAQNNRVRLFDVVEDASAPVSGGLSGANVFAYSVNYRGVNDGVMRDLYSLSPGGLVSIHSNVGSNCHNLRHRLTTAYLLASAPVDLPTLNTDTEVTGIVINGDYGNVSRISAQPASPGHSGGRIQGKIIGTVASITSAALVPVCAANMRIEIETLLTGTWPSGDKPVIQLNAGSVGCMVDLTPVGSTPYSRVVGYGSGNSGNKVRVHGPDGPIDYGATALTNEAAGTGSASRTDWPGVATKRTSMGSGTAPSAAAASRTFAVPYDGAWQLTTCWTNLGKTQMRVTGFLAYSVNGTVTVDATPVYDRAAVGANITAAACTVTSNQLVVSGTCTSSDTWYLGVRLECVGPAV